MNAKNIQKRLTKILPHLLDEGISEKQESEAFTSQRLTHIFTDVLGYDRFLDMDYEVALKNRRADIVLKVDGAFRIVVEVKAKHEVLRQHHIEQAKHYGAVNDIKWVLLTNGLSWNVYYLEFWKSGITEHEVFKFDLREATKLSEACERLAVLHHDAVRDRALEHFWERAKALDHASICRVIFSEETLTIMRRQLRQKHNLLIDAHQIATSVQAMFTPEIRDECGPVKIHRKVKKARPQVKVVSGQVEILPTEDASVAALAPDSELKVPSLTTTQT